MSHRRKLNCGWCLVQLASTLQTGFIRCTTDDLYGTAFDALRPFDINSMCFLRSGSSNEEILCLSMGPCA